MQPHGKFDTGIDAGRNDAAEKKAEPARSRVRLLAARGLAAVLITFAALFALPLQAQAQTIVPDDWSLIPSGLGPGDEFRLLFLSSTKRNASPDGIGTYNTFIQNAAAAGHADIQAYKSDFKVVGCTVNKDATVNTETRSTDTDAPIYWLGGNKVADNYADFYDGSWADEANDKNQAGSNGPNTSQAANYPFTGCDHDGTEAFDSSNNSRALGRSAGISVGRPNSSVSGTGPLTSSYGGASHEDRPFYGLSPLFAVAVVPTKVRFGSTGYHAIEGGAETTVAVSMYPRPSLPLNIPVTVTPLGSTTAADYQIFVNGSLETSDRFSLTFSPDDSGSGAGGIAQRFTVRAVTDSANDHRDSVRFRFGAMPAGTTIEGETDGRAAKTATVWLLEPQTETMDCMTPGASVPNLGKLRNSYNPRRLNSKGQIKNSGDCVWFKVPDLATNRSHQFQLTGRWVHGVLSQITSPQIKIYNSGGMPLVQDGSAVEDEVLEADRRFRAPLIRFTPATAGTYYVRASSLGYDVGHFTISYVDIGPGTAPATAAEPLTATLQDTPTNHDGSSAFTFRIAFSADVEITPQDMRDHALVVSGGTVTNAARVDDRKDLWELTLEPAGSGPVSILTPLERACTETGALCTAEGVMLTVAPALQVAGPVSQGQQAQAPQAPLTAGFTSVPAEHDGQTAFWLELTFGAAVVEGSKQRIRALLGATGGSVTRMRRKDGRLDHWRIKIQPSSHEAVTVTLSPSPPCGAAGAVCTEDGRTYTTALATRIQGPPGLTVADAEVQEGPNAVLSFAVTLSRAPSSTVTVDYATADGTATAGSDYTAVNGALTFAAGETEKTVSVAVLDDAHDEGSETLTLSLSNASGAYIEDGTATGTIKNTDHMPKAWLARFGRTVAEQVLDAVGARVEGNSNSPGPAQLTLGGHRVVLDASWYRAEDTLLGEAGVLGQDLRDVKDLLRAEADASPAREVSTAGLLMASSFHMASAGGEGEDESGRWSLWARGSHSSFSGREDALTLEGDVSTGVMGADYERGRVLAGVAIAYSAGEGSYTEADARGEVESTLLSAYPYLRYTLSERLSVWSVLGLGEGGLTLDIERNDEHIETDVSLAMAAFGARGKLASVAGYDLAVKTDVLFVRTESEAVTGLAAADARTRRLRVSLEGSREVKLDGGVLTPSLEIGLRHDGGDAETGSGLELGGGLRWAGLKGFTMEVRARGLLAHEESDYEEWGVSASIGLSPGEGDRGLSMRVGSAWGAASGGVERLWSQRALTGGSFDPDARLDAEVGYGLDAMRGLLTPYTGVALSEGGETWRAGARFRFGPALELNLEASLTEPDGDGEPASGLVLRGTKRW